MKALLACVLSISAAACTTAATGQTALPPAPVSEAAESKQFIEREGNRLYDGEKEFRFLAVNIPTLWYIEDDWTFARSNPYRLPTEFEIRDVLGSARELGSNVVRAYTVPVRNANFPEESVTFVEAPGVFNEEAFMVMDLAIAVAAENDIRLVIPLVNNWEWMGGRPNYAAFRGKDKDAFCTDLQIREDFKKTISFVTNRINTVTGIAYNADPTIMAWETGNEITCTSEWGIDIARFIKSQAPRQLVVDGWHAVHMPYEGEILRDFPREASINEPAIDLVSTHHYEEDPAAMVHNMRETVARVAGRKPVFPGEFGFMSPTAMERVYDYIISEPAIPGGMIWSLRRHHEEGGWLHHSEPLGAGLYRAYHWPGFNDGEAFGERAFLDLLRRKAFEIRSIPVPELDAPPAPALLPIASAAAIDWQGAIGASGYDVERALSPDGPWEKIAYNIDDIRTPGFSLFNDATAPLHQSAYYRVIARNAHGVSAPSNIVGPVTSTQRSLIDRARSFAVMARWRDIVIASGDFAQYKEAFSRLRGEAGSEAVYTVPGALREARIYAYEAADSPALSFTIADVDEAWSTIDPELAQYDNHRGLIPRLYTVRANAAENQDYLKIDFSSRADIVNVELVYLPEGGLSD